MDNFTNHSTLCHYGILGMKWGVRRYQNPDGSLTKAGIDRYGSKKGLKKHIRTEQQRARSLGRESTVDSKAYRIAEKKAKKAADKYYKDPTERNKSKLELAKNVENTLKNRKEESAKKMISHYNSLVKEFGKESVKGIKYDKYGNTNERMTSAKDWVAAAGLSLVETAVINAVLLPFGIVSAAVYTPASAEQRGKHLYKQVKLEEKKKRI